MSLLAGCGGGGDDNAGAPTVFEVIPTTSTFTAAAGSPTGECFAGGQTTVFVYGGAAPYSINNTVPAYASVSPTVVQDRGGSFTVTLLGGCLTNGSITVVDKLNNVVTFTINNNPASASS